MNKILLYCSALLMIVSCGSPRKMNLASKKSSYIKDVYTIHPKYDVFHVDEIYSEIHFKVSSKELLYERTDGVNLSSNVLISYALYPTYDSDEILDSASLRLVDINNHNIDKFLIGKVNMSSDALENAFLLIKLTDLNRNVTVSTAVEIKKETDLNRQYFIVASAETGTPLFRNYVALQEKVKILYKMRQPKNIYVRYYNRVFPLAAPPFTEKENASFKYKEDSLFVLKISPKGEINFTASQSGFYHFQCDSNSRQGFTLYVFSKSFPEIKKAVDMVAPIRYITSQSEYDGINESVNKKKTVESFWLKNASNKERTRTLIKKYYHRVEETNEYFSSYIEGWRTDRGMVYLVYGPPTLTYRSYASETWIYGDPNTPNALNFSFLKVNNPFTSNDYILERATSFKQSWSLAVDSWRNGRTYFID